MTELKVGLIGGGFMGRAHSNAYNRVPNFFPELKYKPVLQAACDYNPETAKAFAEQWGYASTETDWRTLVERPDIDIVDICVPNNYHREIALAAAAQGKMTVCEKPLAMNTTEGEEMVAAVERAGVANMVCFNYRRVPAVTLAKHIIDSGKLGRIYHYRSNFLQDWCISPSVPQGGVSTWRLDAGSAGSGVTGDLLAHCIDAALWLNGDICNITAMTETFVKERMHLSTGKMEAVAIDDACAFMCRFDNGSLGLFESTRYACGHKALFTFEINGEHASLRWDLHDLHRLELFDHNDPGPLRGWRSIHVTDHGGDHPYMERWWVPGLQIGYEHSQVHQAADFLKALEKGEACSPTFKDALKTQIICEAVLKSASTGTWTQV